MSPDDVWKEFAREVGGTFTEFTFKAKRRVHFSSDEWILLLEMEREHTAFTPPCIHAQFLNLEGVEFTIRPATLLTRIGRTLWFGHQVTGDADFDHRFSVEGHPPDRLAALLRDSDLRERLMREGGSLRTLPRREGSRQHPHLDDLEFRFAKPAAELETLRGARDTLLAALRGLRDSVAEPVAAAAATLLEGEKPRRAADDLMVWDPQPGRLRAAEQLGGCRDGLALRTLVGSVRKQEILAPAARALGAIGDKRYVPTLLTLLGEGGDAEAEAESSLHTLGEGAAADQFHQALLTGETDCRDMSEEYREGFIKGLTRALTRDSLVRAMHAAQVLGQLHALRAIPELERLRQSLRRWPAVSLGAGPGAPPSPSAVLRAVEDALAELQTTEDLPRAAAAPRPKLEALPIAALDGDPTCRALPIAADEEGTSAPELAAQSLPDLAHAPPAPRRSASNEVLIDIPRRDLKPLVAARMLAGVVYMGMASCPLWPCCCNCPSDGSVE
jgi:hypothetical protein